MRMETHPALGRPEREVMLHAVAFIHAHAADVVTHRHRHRDAALGQFEALAQVGVDADEVRRVVKLAARHAKHVGVIQGGTCGGYWAHARKLALHKGNHNPPGATDALRRCPVRRQASC